MAETSPLSPQDLDRVEDALENLEFGELLDDTSPEVARTLADYQQILVASRDALPLQEVRPGLLDGVLAEARASVEGHVLGIGDVPIEEEKPVSFWTRLRRGFLIPGLAVAGSAALILLIVKPKMGDSEATSASAEKIATAPARDDAAAKDSQMAPPPPSAAAPAVVEEEPEEEANAAGEAKLEEIAVSRMSKNKASGVVAPGKAPAPAAEPVLADPAPADEKSKELAEKAVVKADASASWDDVEKGDLARSNGDCFGARNAYRKALDDGNDSVRARALAGIGLCEAKEGDDTAAGEYFDQAEALDPEVESYIGTQRVDAPKPAPKSKRKPSKKRRSKALPKNSYDDIDSPFK